MACGMLALTPTSSATAQEVAWDTLGDIRLKPGGWESTVDVISPKVFNKIRIDVRGGDLDMHDIRLAFENGTVWSMNAHVKFREGSRSFLIDLPDAAHQIRRLAFEYRSLTHDAEPYVRVFGQYVAKATVVINWVHLGSGTIDFARNHEVIDAAGEGPSSALRFWVDSSDVEVYDIRVTVGDEVRSLKTTLYVPPRKGRDIELPGAPGVVRRIEFSYRSPFREMQGKTFVQTLHVYGRP